MNRLIERIEQRRIELGMTQKELLKRTGTPDATYRNYLTGRTEHMSIPTGHRFALALKMSLDELAAYTSDELPPDLMEKIETINNTPATTKEVDTAMTVLIRTFESTNASHAANLHAIEQEFRILADQSKVQFDQLLTAQEERHNREISSMHDRLAVKDRWIRALFAVCCGLSLCICAALLFVSLR